MLPLIWAMRCIGVLWQYPIPEGTLYKTRLPSRRARMPRGLSQWLLRILSLYITTSSRNVRRGYLCGLHAALRRADGLRRAHAAYMATSEKYARRMPGRIIGAESGLKFSELQR